MKCPSCGSQMQCAQKKGKTPGWAIAVAILFFPLGLFALAAKKPAENEWTCHECGYKFTQNA